MKADDLTCRCAHCHPVRARRAGRYPIWFCLNCGWLCRPDAA